MEYANQDVEISVERISTGIEGATEADDILISTRALQMINEIRKQNKISENYFLRIGIQGGGCSGFNYVLGFDSEFDTSSDRKYLIGDTQIVISRSSLFYLMGVTLDYIDTPQGRGFIFSNPNNLPTCGCQS